MTIANVTAGTAPAVTVTAPGSHLFGRVRVAQRAQAARQFGELERVPRKQLIADFKA
ncbi:hypothetical protein ACFVT2_34775 [Streptomyces sp. NPDC058000]|uniref:hypothetical protein n=1 Tax=Streptomyces sp. NPDC058000 TaxID=3346299 RepID=UPI0036EDC3B3